MGRALTRRFVTLRELSRATLEELQEIGGVVREKAIALKAAFTLTHRMAAEIQAAAPLLNQPVAVAALLREECRLCTVEQSHTLLLDTRQ